MAWYLGLEDSTPATHDLVVDFCVTALPRIIHEFLLRVLKALRLLRQTILWVCSRINNMFRTPKNSLVYPRRGLHPLHFSASRDEIRE